jgi:hypothetical protein
VVQSQPRQIVPEDFISKKKEEENKKKPEFSNEY